MVLQEFQAKQILGRHGIAVPSGAVARTVEEARNVAVSLAATPLYVKAQIRAGGRGKAGGVIRAASAPSVEAAARGLLGRRLVTDQSGPLGQTVNRVLVEAGISARRSLYVSLSVDAASGTIVLAVSGAGGETIEEEILSGRTEVERMALAWGSPVTSANLSALASTLDLSGMQAQAFADVVARMRDAFVTLDATLIEINPLALTDEDRFVALDAKITLDDNAAFRQPIHAELREPDEEDDLEIKAQLRQLNFVKLDGNIGLIANGAGLGLATLDMVQAAGGRAANFMDIRTTATSLDVAHGFALLLNNPDIRSLLVNVHGGGMQPCDTIAEGLGIAIRRTGRTLPIVVRLAGNNSDFARSRLKNFGCRYTECPDMWSAAVQAVAASR